MRKLIATEFVTMDGVFEEPGRWPFNFFNDEVGQFKYGELMAADAQLLGRVTFEGFAAAWPTMEGTGDFGEKMNGMKKYVVSNTLKDGSAWNNSTVIRGNVLEEIAKLKQQPGKDILLAGSATLLHSLLPHNLVDELRLMLHPFVMGSGRRLFKDGAALQAMDLVKTQQFATGIIVLHYAPKATPKAPA